MRGFRIIPVFAGMAIAAGALAVPAFADGGPMGTQGPYTIDIVHNDPANSPNGIINGDGFVDCLTVQGYATSVGPKGENKFNGAFQVVKDGRPLSKPVYAPSALVVQYQVETSPGVFAPKTYHPLGNDVVKMPTSTSGDTVLIEFKAPSGYRGDRTRTLIKAGTSRTNPGGNFTLTDNERGCAGQ